MLGVVLVEGAPVTAGLHALGHHDIRAGVLGREGVVEVGRAGEPGTALGVQPLDILGLEYARRGRDDLGAGGEQRFALFVERRGWRPLHRLACRTEPGEEGAGLVRPPLTARRVLVRSFRDPKVDLQRAGGAGAKLLCPRQDPIRCLQHGSESAHPAGLHDCGGQLDRAGSRHGSLEYWNPQAEAIAELPRLI